MASRLARFGHLTAKDPANQRLLLIIDVKTLEIRLARGGNSETRLRQLKASTKRDSLHILADFHRGMPQMPLVRNKLAPFRGRHGWYKRAAFDYLSTQFDIKIFEHERLPTHVAAQGFLHWIGRLCTEERENGMIAPAEPVAASDLFRPEPEKAQPNGDVFQPEPEKGPQESPTSSGEITEPPSQPSKLPAWMRTLARTKL